VPLLTAFNKARKLKKLIAEGRESAADAFRLENELDDLGRTREGVPFGERALADIHGAARTRAVKRPPRDPDLPSNVVTGAYASHSELKQDLAGAFGKLRHGTAVPNPDMVWVRGILKRSAPDTPANRELLTMIDEYYPTVRNPKAAAEFAAYLWQTGAKKQVTPSRALVEFTSGSASPTRVEGYLERSHLLKNSPFIDMNFAAGDPHGRYTHMFMEGMITYFHGAGAGRRFRQAIARATGPPGVSRRKKEFWENVWDAMFDDETGPHINRPEMLGPLLQKHLGLRL
jgi:hypothetical protein